MKGTFNKETKTYDMPQPGLVTPQGVHDALGNELKVRTPVYWKSANVIAEIGHIIQPTAASEVMPALPGELVLIVRMPLEAGKQQIPGLLAIQVPATMAVQVVDDRVAQEKMRADQEQRMQPVAVGSNEEGG